MDSGDAGGGIYVSRHIGGAVLQNETAAVVGFSHRLVAGGAVEDDLCSVQCQMCSRCNRHPQILADFDAEGDVALFIGEEQMPERNLGAEQTDGADIGSDADPRQTSVPRRIRGCWEETSSARCRGCFRAE